MSAVCDRGQGTEDDAHPRKGDKMERKRRQMDNDSEGLSNGD